MLCQDHTSLAIWSTSHPAPTFLRPRGCGSQARPHPTSRNTAKAIARPHIPQFVLDTYRTLRSLYLELGSLSNVHKATMSTAPFFFKEPFRYLRWASINKPAYFYSICVGLAGPGIVAVVVPTRRYLGYERIAKVPQTYPST